VQDLRSYASISAARVTLVAHSYGPLLAASYALAHPDHVNRMVFGPVPRGGETSGSGSAKVWRASQHTDAQGIARVGG
jgi:pimeloyl-ACP methyl ester carboxylesterase